MEVNEEVFIEHKTIQLNGFIESMNYFGMKEEFKTNDFEYVEIKSTPFYKASKTYKYEIKKHDLSIEITVTYMFDESDKVIVSFQVPNIIEYVFENVLGLMMFLLKHYVSSVVSIEYGTFDDGTLIYDILTKCFTKIGEQLENAETDEEINRCQVFETIKNDDYQLCALLGPSYGLSLTLEYEDWDNEDIKLVKRIIN